jgi:hypothetical protein
MGRPNLKNSNTPCGLKLDIEKKKKIKTGVVPVGKENII